MALKFLNKKGWHTGSLRNIENVWKAEQKHEAEQKKLEELRKQIQEERERSEFRLLQEQAGLVPRQERLDFLYDSGLAVGRSDGASASGSGSGFKALEQPSSSSAGGGGGGGVGTAAAKQQSSIPGALFEDKPFSAGDAWRKLHSDPLLLIRQREQEALARVKNNPVKMAQIRKSVEEKKKSKEKKKHKEKSGDKEGKKKHRSSSKHRKHSSDSEDSASSEDERPRKARDYKSSHHEERYHSRRSDSGDELNERNGHRKDRYRDSKYREQSPRGRSEPRTRSDGRDHMNRSHDRSRHEKYPSEERGNFDGDKRSSYGSTAAAANKSDSNYRWRNVASKLSEEERAARLLEMQENADLHEEQRWKRLKRAEEDDKREAVRNGVSVGKNFLDAAQKSVYGAEKGGSSTIEERVRRRAYYSQGREASEGNAFRR